MYDLDFCCRGNREDEDDSCFHHRVATLLRFIMAYYHRFHSLRPGMDEC